MTQEEKRFWKDAYLAALSVVAQAEQVWEQNGKKLTSIPGKSSVAKDFADQAVRNLRRARP